MPPKGTTTVLPALRGKQTKPSAVWGSGASEEFKLQREAKQGAPEKAQEKSLVNVKLKPAQLDKLLKRKSRNGAWSGVQSSWTSNEGSDSGTAKISSELGSELSSPGLEQGRSECDKVATVRKKQRKRNTHPGPATHSHTSMATKDLPWDYTNTQLGDSSAMHPSTETQPGVISLETIYQSNMEHREESKAESRRTQLACRKMQMQIHRVAKTCSEFTTRIGEVETRISKLEDDAALQGALGGSMKAQLGRCPLETDRFRR
ncbi:hypothetical protein NDU88_001837 [Pleurodeles waltl]|uniref:Uncharacterized protein n=1 Tax=Pleurodeles waltl TaxID=8319 RepID=A0AAV7KTP3_PLEWA|nr:hypothetical protein NDU88_001837 [Pleurodeles waltl]